MPVSSASSRTGGRRQVLVEVDEAAGQGPPSPVRRNAAPDEQRLQDPGPDRQHHEVHRDRERLIITTLTITS
jgi:hypothetical protein